MQTRVHWSERREIASRAASSGAAISLLRQLLYTAS